MAIGRENRRSMLSGVTRKRCWEIRLGLLKFDIKDLFDNIDHEFLLRAVRKHVTRANGRCFLHRTMADERQMEHDDGMKGQAANAWTPQGGVCCVV